MEKFAYNKYYLAHKKGEWNFEKKKYIYNVYKKIKSISIFNSPYRTRHRVTVYHRVIWNVA